MSSYITELINEVSPDPQPQRETVTRKPAAPDPMKQKDAMGTALQTAINNANKFRGERDALQKEVNRLNAELEKHKPKAAVEATEEAIQKAIASSRDQFIGNRR